jgi:excisionase family DNA binding protein
MNRSSELISTGEAARLLGASRQHVVDLCDRGHLPCERTPVHRRVRRDAVEAMRRRRELTREERRSLWLNRAVAARVARDPARVLAHAQRNLDRFERIHEGTSVVRWLRRWREVLNAGPEAVMEVLGSSAPEAAELRQNSPFAGVLSERERRAVLDSFAQYWQRPAA